MGLQNRRALCTINQFAKHLLSIYYVLITVQRYKKYLRNNPGPKLACNLKQPTFKLIQSKYCNNGSVYIWVYSEVLLRESFRQILWEVSKSSSNFLRIWKDDILLLGSYCRSTYIFILLRVWRSLYIFMDVWNVKIKESTDIRENKKSIKPINVGKERLRASLIRH